MTPKVDHDDLAAAEREVCKQADRTSPASRRDACKPRRVQTTGSAPALEPETVIGEDRTSTADAILEATREVERI